MLTSSRRVVAKLTRERPPRDAAATLEAGCPSGSSAAGAEAAGDPLRVLKLPVAKAKAVQELHLGQKGLRTLHPNLLHFRNLEVLWLNDNKLEKVEGLLPDAKGGAYWSNDAALGTRRLKRLYLSNNKIATLSGDVERLVYLELLLLANNHLRNMQAVCQRLAQLKSLKQLDLFGNPLAEEVNYRLFVIHSIPSLEIFDQHQVTDQERAAAKNLFGVQPKTAKNYSFFSTAPPSCNAHVIEFQGKRWRRVWHQSAGRQGVFDLRPLHIAELASKATQVHIRNSGRPAQSVTSREGTYPVRRLAASRSLNCTDDGEPARRDDVRAAWEGPPALLEALECKSGDAAACDRPLNRVLYAAEGNRDGLWVVHSVVGDAAESGWRKGAEDPIEIYVDIGKVGDEKVSDMSRSVQHLQNEVVKIRREATAEETKAKTAAARGVEGVLARRDVFHQTWSRRLGKDVVEGIKHVSSQPDASEKQRLRPAMELLKMPTDDASIDALYNEVHKDAQHVSCLFSVDRSRHFSDREPFVPDRDGDCFLDCFNAAEAARAGAAADKRDEQAVELCFAPATVAALGEACGTDVRRDQAEALVGRCMPQASPAARVAASVVRAFGAEETLPLRKVLAAVAREPEFVAQLVEECRQGAEADVLHGRAADAAAKHARMNRLNNLLQVRTVRPVGAQLAGRPSSAEARGKRSGSPRARAQIVEGAAEETPRPAPPPCGTNPLLGRVGTGVEAAHRRHTRRELGKAVIAATLCLVAQLAVPRHQLPSFPHAPWS